MLLRIPYSEYRMGVDGIPPHKQGGVGGAAAGAAAKDRVKPVDVSKNVKVVAPLGTSRHTDFVDNLFEGER